MPIQHADAATPPPRTLLDADDPGSPPCAQSDAAPSWPALAGRAVVVTGASGFIGAHLTRALTAAGAQLAAMDERATPLPAAPGLRTWSADLLTTDLADVFAGADTVFHLAGRPGVRQSWGPSFADYVRSNLLGTERVVQACTTAGVRRLVLASSSSVYGPGLGRASRESDPTGPVSPYGVSKLAAEHLCLAHALRSDAATSVVALRYFTVYGPGQRPDMLIGRLLHAVRTGRPARIFGAGTQSRDFTYVDDVVAATLSAATVDGQAEVVNVAGGEPRTIAEVVDLVGELAGRPVPTRRDAEQDGDVESTCADLTRARIRLGYQPRVSLREGLARHLAWDITQHTAPVEIRLHDPVTEPCAPAGSGVQGGER